MLWYDCNCVSIYCRFYSHAAYILFYSYVFIEIKESNDCYFFVFIEGAATINSGRDRTRAADHGAHRAAASCVRR